MMKAILSIFLVLAMVGFAPAADSAHKHAPSPSMAKQHHAMSSASKHWQAAKKSLQEGDLEKTEKSLEGMQKALADLEGFQLHKNKERGGEFKDQARNFKENLVKMADAVKERKSDEVQNLIPVIDNGCLQCHKIFR